MWIFWFRGGNPSEIFESLWGKRMVYVKRVPFTKTDPKDHRSAWQASPTFHVGTCLSYQKLLVNLQCSNYPVTGERTHLRTQIWLICTHTPKASSAHTDLTHLYTQRVFGSVHTHIPLGSVGGWVGGVGMATYLGLAYIPNYHVLNTNYHVLQNQLL